MHIHLAVERLGSTRRADHAVEEVAAGLVGAQAIDRDPQIAFAALGVGEGEACAAGTQAAGVDAQHQHARLVVAVVFAVEGGDDATDLVGVGAVEGVKYANALGQLGAGAREGEDVLEEAVGEHGRICDGKQVVRRRKDKRLKGILLHLVGVVLPCGVYQACGDAPLLLPRLNTVMATEFSFICADLQRTADLDAFTKLNREYFTWMDGELRRITRRSLADIVGCDLESYVHRTVTHVQRLPFHSGQLYFLVGEEGEVAAMGGLRMLPDGVLEVVRVYTRPEYRGLGLGSRMVEHLIGEAERKGHALLRLDTGVFMHAAQKIYAAAGFVRCDPYPGAEPPEFLQPFWIYMERKCVSVDEGPGRRSCSPGSLC